ncbi:MAG TPA: hypothetical protein VM913_02385 [Sphingomicrobium sp.]|nr:hypothetical protein [Sphingomicrobium sp.]
MGTRVLVAAATLLAVLSQPAAATPRRITIINGTGMPLAQVAARPVNDPGWTALTPGLSPGARTQVTVDPDLCAYEMQGSAAGAVLAWRGVNLCETSSVTLNRRADGVLWVDYD